MVKKSVIEKLSSQELEKYIKPESRFVSEAIRYAFEILQQRGRIFSNEETDNIHKLILKKEREENKLYHQNNRAWDKNTTEDESAIELYSQISIWIFSIIFGVIFGTTLQAFNFLKIKNRKAFYITIIAGILYTVFQILILDYANEYLKNIHSARYSSPRFVLSALGASLLFFIWEYFFPKDLKYRKKSIATPLIISIIIYIPIVYAIFKGW